MEKQKLFIFDLDGTCYAFDKGKSKNFSQSQLKRDLDLKIDAFIGKKRSATVEEVGRYREEVAARWGNETSLAVENELKIPREEYFNGTWGELDPANYALKSPELVELVQAMEGRAALLTAAPKVWALNMLAYLGVAEYFTSALFTGDPDLRKPNPEVFKLVADRMGVEYGRTMSIGDQLSSDILPAKQIGMNTILVGDESEDADYSVPSIAYLLPLLKEEGIL